jgi:hypothetical protein
VRRLEDFHERHRDLIVENGKAWSRVFRHVSILACRSGARDLLKRLSRSVETHARRQRCRPHGTLRVD